MHDMYQGEGEGTVATIKGQYLCIYIPIFVPPLYKVHGYICYTSDLKGKFANNRTKTELRTYCDGFVSIDEAWIHIFAPETGRLRRSIWIYYNG